MQFTPAATWICDGELQYVNTHTWYFLRAKQDWQKNSASLQSSSGAPRGLWGRSAALTSLLLQVGNVRQAKEAPLSHRKLCSWSAWNASSIAPPLIQWLCDITLHHHVPNLHYLCIAAGLAQNNLFREATVFLLVLLAQVCVTWPIRADSVFGESWLKQGVSGRGGIQWTVEENWCMFWELKYVNLF